MSTKNSYFSISSNSGEVLAINVNQTKNVHRVIGNILEKFEANICSFKKVLTKTNFGENLVARLQPLMISGAMLSVNLSQTRIIANILKNI